MQSPYSNYLEGTEDVTGVPLGSAVSPLIWKLDWHLFLFLILHLHDFKICIKWDLIFSYNTISNLRISNSHTLQPRWSKSLQQTNKIRDWLQSSICDSITKNLILSTLKFDYISVPPAIHFSVSYIIRIWIAADSRSVWIVASLYVGWSVLWSLGT